MKHTAIHRVCLYGPPKGGKTRLAGMLAEHYNILYIGLENGHTTLFSLPESYQERIEVLQIPDSKEFPIAVETVLKIVKGAKVTICETHGKVNCPACMKPEFDKTEIELNALDGSWVVVIDSGTQFTASALAHITKGQPDTYKLQLDDWGNLKVLCEKLGSQMQVAPYNLVFITHEEEVELEDKTTKIVPVLGSSKSSRNTAKYFDHVVYCGVRNKKHIVGSATTYAMSLMTGSRTDVELEKQTEGNEQGLLQIFTGYRNGKFVGGSEELGTAEVRTNAGVVSTTAVGVSSAAEPINTAVQPGQGTKALSNLEAIRARMTASKIGS